MSEQTLPLLIAIAGPTGSGKTALGIDVAKQLDTEIISCDSMAVYRGMDIGTAKPRAEERGGVPHHLLDVVTPDEAFTAADFVRLARPILERLHARGKIGLLVGGTGLYLRALVHGLFEGPPADPHFREELQAFVEEERLRGVEHGLHRRLVEKDPQTAARLHPRDHVRIIRALEVLHHSGRTLSSWQDEHRFRDQRYRYVKWVVDLPRETLYARIEARVQSMVEAGLERETEQLLLRYGSDVKPMKGLGYLHFVKYLRGEWNYETAIETLKRDTRRFARRQLTWFRHEPDVQWIESDREKLLLAARNFVEKHGDFR